jgi:hypothetical protein
MPSGRPACCHNRCSGGACGSCMPIMTMRSSGTTWKPGICSRHAFQQWPASVATGMPSKRPVSEVSGVSLSGCASSQTIPSPSRRRPLVTPIDVLQSPANTIGTRPAARAPATSSATSRFCTR